MTNKITQKAKIMRILIENKGSFVAMPVLVRALNCSCSLNQRIMDLRKDGWNIINRKQYKNGKTLSSYKLL